MAKHLGSHDVSFWIDEILMKFGLVQLTKYLLSGLATINVLWEKLGVTMDQRSVFKILRGCQLCRNWGFPSILHYGVGKEQTEVTLAIDCRL